MPAAEPPPQRAPACCALPARHVWDCSWILRFDLGLAWDFIRGDLLSILGVLWLYIRFWKPKCKPETTHSASPTWRQVRGCLKMGEAQFILLFSKHPKTRSLKLTCIHTNNYAWHCPKPVYHYQPIVVQLMLFFKKLSAHHGTETQLSHVMNLKDVLMLGAIMPASNRTVQPAESGDTYVCTAFASSAPGLLN